MTSAARPPRRSRRWLVAGLLVVAVLGAYGGYRLLPHVAASLSPAGDLGTPAPGSNSPTPVSSSPATTAAPSDPSASSASGSAGPAPSLPEGTPPPMPTLPPGSPAAASALRVPVLIYHLVIPGADPAAADYQMTPDLFEAQLRALAARGWQSVTARQLAVLLAAGTPPPQRTFVITLDDGTADHLSQALPVLQRHRFVATFFVISGYAGTAGYLTWDQVRVLRDAGMEIGSHSATHPRMTDITPEQDALEVATAQRVIGLQLGAQPVTFAYPGGAVNDAAIKAVHDAGLFAAFTTAEGHSASWAARLTIPRINVGAQWSADKLLSLLEGYVR